MWDVFRISGKYAHNIGQCIFRARSSLPDMCAEIQTFSLMLNQTQVKACVLFLSLKQYFRVLFSPLHFSVLPSSYLHSSNEVPVPLFLQHFIRYNDILKAEMGKRLQCNEILISVFCCFNKANNSYWLLCYDF